MIEKEQTLWESLKARFMKDPELPDYESEPEEDDIDIVLNSIVPTGFKDDGLHGQGFGLESKKELAVRKQAQVIRAYRNLLNIAEVNDALKEIVNEAVFNPQGKDHIKIDFDSEIIDSLKDIIQDELDNIDAMMNLKKNMYSVFKKYYVDGQLNFHLSYAKGAKGAKGASGIKDIKIISPINFIYNKTKKQFEYVKESDGSTVENTAGFDIEEIVRIDSGEYSNDIILGNLHPAIKPASMLTTLENMLVPTRYNRSKSRRLFNVDVGGLNPAKAQEAMNKIEREFKTSKYYDVKKGTISTETNMSSLTEDYWLPNRDGGKGTTVEMMDESFSEDNLNDLQYVKRKLYLSMNVPIGRLAGIDSAGEAEFSTSDDTISREELAFFSHISRSRIQFLDGFYEIIKRQLISKGKCTEEEWVKIRKQFTLKFTNENTFFEKMERDKLSENLGIIDDLDEKLGKFFSYEMVFKDVLKMDEEQIKELSEQIAKEKKDPLYAAFYNSSEEEW